MMNFAAISGLGCSLAFMYDKKNDKVHAWAYRDDIGAFWGIKGYEEMVSEVGTHKGHLSWPQYRFFGTFDSASVRRGF